MFENYEDNTGEQVPRAWSQLHTPVLAMTVAGAGNSSSPALGRDGGACSPVLGHPGVGPDGPHHNSSLVPNVSMKHREQVLYKLIKPQATSRDCATLPSTLVAFPAPTTNNVVDNFLNSFDPFASQDAPSSRTRAMMNQYLTPAGSSPALPNLVHIKQEDKEEAGTQPNSFLSIMQGQHSKSGYFVAPINDLERTPLFSGEAQLAMDSRVTDVSYEKVEKQPWCPQYALLGIREMTYNVPDVNVFEEYVPERNLIFSNTRAPWSTLVCGSEEAGTSHSLICTLENLLLPKSPAHVNPRASAGMVFHCDEWTSDIAIQPCKAAYLCSKGVSVRILVSRSNFRAMHKLYTTMPGLGPDVPTPTVIPLQLQQEQLSLSRMMTLMTVTDESPGLQEVVYRILREMALEDHHGGGIDYLDFKSRLARQELGNNQRRALQKRLWLIDAFVADSKQSRDGKMLLEELFTPAPGTLTVIDLSCPFTSEKDACALFSVCLSAFAESRAQCGRVLAVDGAHKFLKQSMEAGKLTDQLVSVMSKQQQLGIHTIVTTQEPTLDRRLLNLFDVKIVHRFNSPVGTRLLQDHLTGPAVSPEQDLFRDAVCLQTDQALIFCPTARIHLQESTTGQHAAQLKTGFIRVKIRPSFTAVSEDEFMASSELDEGEVLEYELDFGPIRPLDTCTSNGVPARTAVREHNRPTRPSGLAPASRQMVNHLQQAAAPPAAPPTASPVRPQGPSTVRAAPARVTNRDHLVACLRSETTNLLRQNPKAISFTLARNAAARTAAVHEEFFYQGRWLKLSRAIIHDQIDAHVKAYHIPKPKLN